MAPSSSEAAPGKPGGAERERAWRVLDRLALGGMALGVGLQLQGWWAGGFRAGFFLTLVSVILHVVTTHRTGAEA